MIRRVLTFGLAVAVQAGAVCAPFLHAHVDEDHDDHHSTSVHAHLSGHTPSHALHHGIAVDEPDHDRAVYLQLFVAVQATPFEIPAIAPALSDLTALPERPAHGTVEVTHGHDPPLVAALDSRPPPVLPVLL
ncbi:MAG TPA: hypothetical protein VI485_33035 [Vicinamibacterales bacterium]|nr:hypothetical protein [Vicinamibacterales bacterium]